MNAYVFTVLVVSRGTAPSNSPAASASWMSEWLMFHGQRPPAGLLAEEGMMVSRLVRLLQTCGWLLLDMAPPPTPLPSEQGGAISPIRPSEPSAPQNHQNPQPIRTIRTIRQSEPSAPHNHQNHQPIRTIRTIRPSEPSEPSETSAHKNHQHINP